MPFSVNQDHMLNCLNFTFLGLVTVEVIEECFNVSGVQEEAPAKGTSEQNDTSGSAGPHSTCGLASVESHLRQHKKLRKVSAGISGEHGQTSEFQTWKDGGNSHRPQRDTFSLASPMEKLVEAAHFGKRGMI